MAGKVSLPVTVEIGFGAGPMDATVTWTDVSQWVQRSKTIACNRSIDTTTMTPGDGRGSLRLSNKDGDFTPGATGAFGLVRNRLPVRIRQGSTVVWTGQAEKWSAGVDGIRPVVDLTLVDRWPRMRQRVLTGDRILQVCQALGASDLWPMTDPGPNRFAATQGVDLVVNVTSGPASFAAAPNPQGTALPSTATWAVAENLYDQLVESETSPTSGGVLGASFSVWVKLRSIASGGVGATISSGTGNFAVFADSVGVGASMQSPPGWGVLNTGTISAAAMNDTLSWHHVAATLTLDGSRHPTLTAYCDGAPVGALSDAINAVDAAFPSIHRFFASASDADTAYLAYFPRALTAAEVAAIAAAGLDALGTTGQAPDTRAALAAALWPPTTLTTQGTFAATMSKQAIDGVSQAGLLAACAVTEGGMLHIGTGGWPVLTARGARSDASLAATIPASVIETSAQWELDDTQVVNVATVERMALGETASTLSRRNDSSVADYGEVTKTVQGWWDTDAQAVERADTEVAMWADPSPRSKSFTVDLMTASTVISPATLLAVDIGSRILLTGLPSQTPTQTAAGWYVDGIADEITHDSWKRTLTVTPAIDFWVIDDATFGGLDEWPLG